MFGREAMGYVVQRDAQLVLVHVYVRLKEVQGGRAQIIAYFRKKYCRNARQPRGPGDGERLSYLGLISVVDCVHVRC